MGIKELIAAHLNTSASQITKVTELYKVWCVVVAGRRSRFVSKLQVLGEEIKSLSPITWTLTAQMRRQEGKKWVARIDGLCKEYGFKRTFLSAQFIEWGKYGMKKAVFEIQEPGYYQDSDGDYFRVFVSGNSLDAECCSKLEVQARFGVVKV
ncbi:hypothetical protein PCC6912_51020 [Chlorogloeopsis fritschii PCC 6912]|uniref:Uncharacterized protein n=1 Tax=Chlorogloeopsis fritschii PCC 6912 TaxID=211165 RepID=A0A3S0ZL40_CHLFR|nr:hypothetical protein [Chlorogloeopsis fritschii]RUR74924.1 hypothetical protein PCC6912_51020 [Chlorogloeopsis fritschii PCC 6912]